MTAPTAAGSDSRLWIAQALRLSPPATLPEGGAGALLEAGAREGVLPLLDSCLRESGSLGVLPAELHEALTAAARAAAVQELSRRAEARRVCTLLQREGLQALLLKGTALGQWLYPAPYLRITADIDLLLASREAAERLGSMCAELGYALQFKPASSSFEMTARRVVDGASRSELDLHWRLVNAAAYADIFRFEELWSESIALPAFGQALRGLSPRHALAHACLNRALDLQIGVPDQLRLLYDVHLMLQRMDAAAWDDVLAMVVRKRIAGVCLRSIEDAVAAFGTELPASASAALHRSAADEPIDWRRLHDWRYMQWQNLKALPGWAARLRWLWQRLFLTGSHLREMHGEGSWLQLMVRRIARGVARLRGRG